MKFFKNVSFLFCFLFVSLFAKAKHIGTLPPPEGFKTQKPLIYLDPGHGGLDLGALIKSPYIEEKKICLTTAHLTKRYLEQMGYRVSMTRSRDFFVPLEKRVNLANKARAGIYVCIHYNSCPNDSADGIEVYYTDEKNKRSLGSKKLASSVLTNTVSRTSAKSRGVKRANFFVTRQTKMPSILIEAGFLTNSEERAKIKQRDYIDKIAKGIAEGIDKFIKN